MIATALPVGVLVLSAIVIIGTFLPLIPTHAGIVRICDFPRPQMLIGGIVALMSIFLLFGWQNWAFWIIGLLLLVAIGLQASRILPYLPFMPPETLTPNADKRRAELSLFLANLLIHNRNAAKVLELIDENDPDIIFVVEADTWWENQFKTMGERYPHVTALPQDDGYGLIFMTRLSIDACEVRKLMRENIPSIKAKLRLSNGGTFWFYGVHPEPPGPVQDAEDRDAELLVVAREMRDDGHPSIVAGDLNDVAWSRTTASFQHISQALDPRRGRGFYATFHADCWFARWPLDHMFHTKEFATDELKILAHIGSDHFPVFARLSMVAATETSEVC